jgi:aspartyl-tRNA(Asn)/glutamyl-tRNA(Gln) amidotransferase subunit C
MISRQDIEALATLARLELSEADIESLQADVENILEFVGQINAVEGADATPQAPRHHNVMRADEVRASGDPLEGKEEAVRAQFPTSLPAQGRAGDYNVVRKILQKDE